LKVVAPMMSAAALLKVFDETAELIKIIFTKKVNLSTSRSALSLINRLLMQNSIFANPNAVDLYKVLLLCAINGVDVIQETSLKIISDLFGIDDNRKSILQSVTIQTISRLMKGNQEKVNNMKSVLKLFETLISYLPEANTKNLIEKVLHLSRFGSEEITGAAYSCIKHYVKISPPTVTISVVNALLDPFPGNNPKAQIQAIVEGLIRLHAIDPIVTQKKFLYVFKQVMAQLQQGEQDFYCPIMLCLFVVVIQKETITECVIHQMSEDGTVRVYEEVVKFLKEGLKFAYQRSWESVLKLIDGLLTVTYQHRPTESEHINTLQLILQPLVLDLTIHMENFKGLVNSCYKLFLLIFGSDRFLEIFPLRYPTIEIPISQLENPSNNLWVLAFFQESLKNSKLQIFDEQFFKKYVILEQNAKKATDSGKSLY